MTAQCGRYAQRGPCRHSPVSLQYSDRLIRLALYCSDMATVPVSDYVKEELGELKDKEEHTSYDSLMRSMIRDYEVEK